MLWVGSVRTPTTLLLLSALLLLLAAPHRSQAKDPWAGSAITYRNAVSVLSLQKDAELTYNPYYAMSLSIRPQWWITDVLYTHARFSITRELTDSDVTSQAGETWASDLAIRFGGSNFYTIPVVGLAFSADVDLIAPTSPVSQARTMQIGLAPGVGVRRDFDVLSGISIGYGFRASWYSHDSTTAQRDLPSIPGCAGLGGCDEYLNTGLRNTEWRLTHNVFANFGFTDWFALSASLAVVTDTLYDAVQSDQVSLVPQTPQDQRFLLSTDISMTFTPMKSLGITLGANTTNPQLAPDSSFRTPFFNRYTVVYLDLSLNIAGLVSQIRD